VPVRFSLFLITVEVVTARKEEEEGTETHEMNMLGPHTSSVASSLARQSVSTGQDINDAAQSVVSKKGQAEGVTLIWLFHPETIILLCYRIRGKRHLRDKHRPVPQQR
jgi:hypothetical protein